MARPHNASQRAVRILCIYTYVRESVFRISNETHRYLYILFGYWSFVRILYGRIALKKCKARKDRKTRDFRYTQLYTYTAS